MTGNGCCSFTLSFPSQGVSSPDEREGELKWWPLAQNPAQHMPEGDRLFSQKVVPPTAVTCGLVVHFARVLDRASDAAPVRRGVLEARRTPIAEATKTDGTWLAASVNVESRPV